MEVIWSDLAIHDLQNIAEYISDNFGDKVSEKSVNKILKEVELKTIS